MSCDENILAGLHRTMKNIITLLAFLTLTQQSNIYQRKTVYNVLIALRNNVSVIEQAKALLTRSLKTSSLKGNWNVKFSEIQVFSQPRRVLSQLSNITKDGNVDGMIFAETSNTAGFMSQVVMNTIPTIGLRTTKSTDSKIPLSTFTRLPTPPLQQFAYVIRDLTKKMGWRRILIIDTADELGLQFVKHMTYFFKEERWKAFNSILVDGSLTSKIIQEIRDEIHGTKPDVIVANGNYIHGSIVNMTSSVWLITDQSKISIHEVPTGVLRISQQREYHGDDDDLELIADAMMMFSSAVSHSANELCQSKGLCGDQLNKTMLRKHAIRYLTLDQVSHRISVFTIRNHKDRPTSTFDIQNLRQDLHGHKYWTNIGMWTPVGIALDTFRIQQGRNIKPPLKSPRPVLRVPVVDMPSWMNVGKPDYTTGECLNGSPCFTLDEKGNKRDKYCCVGAQIDLVNLLENDLGFEAFIYFVPDGEWGGLNTTSRLWSGLMGQLTLHHGDFTSLLGISAARSEAVDFTQPYMELGINILVRRNDTQQRRTDINWKFLDPFKIDLWLMITAVSNIFLLVIWALDRLSPHGHRKRITELLENDKDSSPQDNGFTLLDSMSYVWGVAFSKDIGAENTPRSPSARFVSTFFAFMALILVNTYCANLTAVLMKESFTSPIEGIRDEKLVNPALYPPDGFQLGVVRSTIEEWYFRNHSDVEIQRLYNINIKINMVDSYKQGFSQLKNKKLDGLVGDRLSLEYLASDSQCNYRLIGQSFYKFGIGFAFQKNSPWLHKATLSVLTQQENGTIERLKKLRFPSNTCQSSHALEFNINDFSGLFLTVIGVIVFAILSLIAEVFLIILLTRHWKWLGKLGTKLRHFVLEINSDDEQVDFQFFRSFGEKSWDLKHGKRTLQMQNGNTRNGVTNGGRARFINYGFSSRDFNDEWMNSTSRISCSSVSINDHDNTEDGLKTTEIKNGRASTKRKTSHDELPETNNLSN